MSRKIEPQDRKEREQTDEAGLMARDDMRGAGGRSTTVTLPGRMMTIARGNSRTFILPPRSSSVVSIGSARVANRRSSVLTTDEAAANRSQAQQGVEKRLADPLASRIFPSMSVQSRRSKRSQGLFPRWRKSLPEIRNVGERP